MSFYNHSLNRNAGDQKVFENMTAYSHRDEVLAQVEIAVQTTILILAIFGNATVLIVLLRRKRRLSRMHLLMIHLSIADIFVALCSLLPQLIWDITYVFHGGDFLCRLVKYLQIVAIYASAYVLVMTAIDRYIAIVHPFISQKMSPKRVHFMIGIAWTLSLLFSTPQIFIFSMTDRGDGTQDCWALFNPIWTLELYIIAFTLSVYLVPTLILAICYGRICYTVWKRGTVGEQISSSNENASSHLMAQNVGQYGNVGNQRRRDVSRGISKTKMKTVRMTLAVVFCYLICWSPFFIFQLWGVYDEAAFLSNAAFAISLLLASLNSCTNPWIYLVFSERALDTIQRWFSCEEIVKRHCGFSPVDVVFVLDSSGSVNRTNFEKELRFVSKFANEFDIGPKNVQIGVVTFSSTIRNKINLDQFSNKSDLVAAIQKIDYQPGTTHTGDALLFAMNRSFSSAHGDRPGVKNVMIVLTDGISNKPLHTMNAAKMVHDAGIETIAIGVGNMVSLDELRYIASDNQHVFQVSNFGALQTLQKELKNTTCEAITTSTMTSMNATLRLHPVSTFETPPPPCVDRLDDCDQYGIRACLLYRTWAEKNCARTCGVCDDQPFRQPQRYVLRLTQPIIVSMGSARIKSLPVLTMDQRCVINFKDGHCCYYAPNYTFNYAFNYAISCTKIYDNSRYKDPDIGSTM
ncbi:hypothetical protein FSP39_022857 [Pinctada imbricata]|uniref:Uncharacterized protein n=1 Tax=Pinctada imbricata TaxID=66713 RepID=A0AA88XLQ4_PINIB|nr:hypothetical protein FSP39_022857 [Pinctada imbricata]